MACFAGAGSESLAPALSRRCGVKVGGATVMRRPTHKKTAPMAPKRKVSSPEQVLYTQRRLPFFLAALRQGKV